MRRQTEQLCHSVTSFPNFLKAGVEGIRPSIGQPIGQKSWNVRRLLLLAKVGLQLAGS